MKLDTPCIGVCSTVYGDDVCRGCKRFYHEVIEWNTFDRPQKDDVFNRLFQHIAEAMEQYVVLDDIQLIEQRLEEYQIRSVGKPYTMVMAFNLLRHTHHKLESFSELGISPKPEYAQETLTSLFTRVDNQVYQVACENFKMQLCNQEPIKYE